MGDLERNYLPVNPHKVTGCIGKPAKRTMQFWTQEEYIAFLAAVKDPMAHMAVETLFYTGMRVGELLALTLADVDFKGCIISVTKTYAHHNKENQITPPKTHNNYRTVTIPPFLRDHLKKYTECFYSIAPEDRLFLCYPEWLRYQILITCQASGVKLIRIHDIRYPNLNKIQTFQQKYSDCNKYHLKRFGFYF